jgi:hypothetical protein
MRSVRGEVIRGRPAVLACCIVPARCNLSSCRQTVVWSHPTLVAISLWLSPWSANAMISPF